MKPDEAQKLLPDYVEGNLDRQTALQLQNMMDKLPELQQDYQMLVELARSSAYWKDEAVSKWQPQAGPKQRLTVSWPWLNWSSLALSVTAHFLVALQAQISVSSHGFQASFGQPPAKIKNGEQLARRIEQWSRLQQSYIDARLLKKARPCQD